MAGRTLPGVERPCRDCGRMMRAGFDRCPHCGRAQVPAPPPAAQTAWYARTGFWCSAVAIVVVLALLAVVSPESVTPSPLAVGGSAVVSHRGAEGALLAADAEAYNELLDGQNSGSVELLDRMFRRGRTFLEPNGSRVLVVKLGFASAYVEVREGSNVGREGWVQREMLSPVTGTSPRP